MVARAIAPSRARRAGAHPIRPETVNSHRIEQERTGLDTAAAPRTSCHWSTADGSALFVASSRCQPGTELSIGDCVEGGVEPEDGAIAERVQGRSRAGHLAVATCTRRDREGTAHPCAHASWEGSRRGRPGVAGMRRASRRIHLPPSRRGGSPGEAGGNQRPSKVIGGHQENEGAIKGHQKHSMDA